MNAIITHTDFDGVVCGALLTLATKIKFIKFVSHNQIWKELLNGNEIIADLPCPWKCKLWFDHHESNFKDMQARGVNPEEIPGKFQVADSCASIIYDYYKNEIEYPEYFSSIVQEADIIDSMNYNSVETWLEKTPIKMIASTTQMLKDEDYRSFLSYLLKITKHITKFSPDDLITLDFFVDRYKKFEEYKENTLTLIKKVYYFHKYDYKKKIAILDFTEFKRPPRMDKNFLYIFEPDADAVLLINSAFKNNVKTNDLKFSMGVNFTKSDMFKNINIASIFEELELGGGHPKVAGGVLKCYSKNEKLTMKNTIIEDILNKWTNQLQTNPSIL